MVDLKTKLSELRVRILDLWILGSSLISIGVAAFMIIYCAFFLDIDVLKPYLLYIALGLLGLMGFRYYLKEVEL